ncbi:MAG: sigma-70 family RNA polymerase sigma factor [Alphaproteobacteria bacterium]
MVLSGQESDEILMERVQRGDQQAFAALVRRHTKMFFAAAFRMSGNRQEAEDCVQAAFIKLWEKPQSWDASRGVKFTTWFYRVVTNLAIDGTRRRKKNVSADVLDYMPDGQESALDMLVNKETKMALETAIQSLPERQKAALNLCFYEGLSNQEAADILGVGIKALESLLMRAKSNMRETMAHKNIIDFEERRHTHA